MNWVYSSLDDGDDVPVGQNAVRLLDTEPIYYVYVYLDPRKLGTFDYAADLKFGYEPFYVGKGKGARSISHLRLKRYNNPSKVSRIEELVQLGYELTDFIIKIKEGLYEKDAFEVEQKTITSIGRLCDGTGPLTNLTIGGDGGDTFTNNPNKELIRDKCKTMLGKKHSEATLALIKKNHPKYWLGKKQSEQTIQKRADKIRGRPSEKKGTRLSESTKQKIKENSARYWLGKHHNQETKDKLREKRKTLDMSYRWKTYKLIAPDGQEFIVPDGLEKFCTVHCLARTKLVLVAQGKRNHHKGWRCSYVDK